MHTSTNIQRNILSMTMATYFQSSFTWQRGDTIVRDISNFTPRHLFFYQLSAFTLDWFLSNGRFFSLCGSYLLNVSQSPLVPLMKNSRSNYGGRIVSETGRFGLEIGSALYYQQWRVSLNTITSSSGFRIILHIFEPSLTFHPFFFFLRLSN